MSFFQSKPIHAAQNSDGGHAGAEQLKPFSSQSRWEKARVGRLGLLIAVASLTTVAFFADRVRQALSSEASQLLGADLVVVKGEDVRHTSLQNIQQIAS